MKATLVFLLGCALDAAALTRSQADCRTLLETVVASFDAANVDRETRLKCLIGETPRAIVHESRIPADLDATADPNVLADGALSIDQLEMVRRTISSHPVAGLEFLPKHDPTGSIGFCFGRGMAAHLQAVLEGADERHIKKVFIKGRFVNPTAHEKFWSYHAAAAIRADDGVWYAIDPRLDGPVSIVHWGAHWSMFADEDGVQFRVFDPHVMHPGGARYAAYFHSSLTEKRLPESRDERIYAYMKALAESYHATFASISILDGFEPRRD